MIAVFIWTSQLLPLRSGGSCTHSTDKYFHSSPEQFVHATARRCSEGSPPRSLSSLARNIRTASLRLREMLPAPGVTCRPSRGSRSFPLSSPEPTELSCGMTALPFHPRARCKHGTPLHRIHISFP